MYARSRLCSRLSCNGKREATQERRPHVFPSLYKGACWRRRRRRRRRRPPRRHQLLYSTPSRRRWCKREAGQERWPHVLQSALTL
jgi:hypothetical protein